MGVCEPRATADTCRITHSYLFLFFHRWCRLCVLYPHPLHSSYLPFLIICQFFIRFLFSIRRAAADVRLVFVLPLPLPLFPSLVLPAGPGPGPAPSPKMYFDARAFGRRLTGAASRCTAESPEATRSRNEPNGKRRPPDSAVPKSAGFTNINRVDSQVITLGLNYDSHTAASLYFKLQVPDIGQR